MLKCDQVIAERGLLSVSDDVWDLAVRRAAVIGPLADAGVVGLAAAAASAAELGVP
jgi:putative transposase